MTKNERTIPCFSKLVILNMRLSIYLQIGDKFDSDLHISKCGKSSGCITYPKDCAVHDCDLAISYKTVSDGIKFRVTSKRAPITESYVALGISTDQNMVTSGPNSQHYLFLLVIFSDVYCSTELSVCMYVENTLRHSEGYKLLYCFSFIMLKVS